MALRKFRGFEATGETEIVCFNGWDGKSYDGETEKLPVYKLDTHFAHLACNSERRFVPKYTKKWGWTMHEIMYKWDKIGEGYEVDYYCETDKIDE